VDANELSQKITFNINKAMQAGISPPQIIAILEYLKVQIITRDLDLQEKMQGAKNRKALDNAEIIIEGK
jgi:hypothetical protein